MTIRPALIDRFDYRQLPSGKYGIIDQTYSLIRPIYTVDTQEEAEEWLREHPEQMWVENDEGDD